MAITIGATAPNAIHVGATAVAEVYAGATKVWPVGPPPAPFAPDDLAALRVWLDAADATTLTLVGSRVDAWASRVNGYVFNRSSGVPTYVSTPGDEKINFNAAYLTDSGVGVPYAVSIFIIGENDTTRLSNAFIGGPNSSRNLISRSSVGKLFMGRSSGSTSIQTAPNVGTGDIILSCIFNNATQPSAFFIDGASIGTATIGGSGVGNGNFYIGGNSNVPLNQDLDGHIREIIVVDGVVNEADRQRIEGYLAHKWGLTASLPAAHPYKASAP